MHKRINITLPEETLALIDRVTEHGDRSRFIDEAIKHYIVTTNLSLSRGDCPGDRIVVC